MKQPILWIHGWGMPRDVWRHSWAKQPHMQGLEHYGSFFAEYEHHYVNFADCNGVEDFRKAILREFHRNLSGNWIVVGWSMGGMLALELLLDQESRKRHNLNIESTVIVAGTLRFVSEDRHLGWPLRVLERMKSRLLIAPQETLLDFKKLVFGSDINSIHSENYKEEFTPAGLMAGLNYLIETDLREPWEQYLTARALAAETNLISPQLFWIHGSHDLVCPIHAVPDLSFKHTAIIESAGHIPFITEPIHFYELLRGFLHVRQYKQRTVIVE
ncbi:MAG TPA: alpha/beta fold hydrolase [Bacilli bacterium]